MAPSARAGRGELPAPKRYYSCDVYRDAFTTAKGPRETRLMVGGFLGMFVLLFGSMAAVALVGAHTS